MRNCRKFRKNTKYGLFCSTRGGRSVPDKKEMSEEDIKLQFITPAITAKWERSRITMETKITDGRINLKGNFIFREKPKKADYILYASDNNPIAGQRK